MSQIPKDRTVDAMTTVWSSLSALLSGLSDDEWRRASPLPGWDVQANVAHMIGTEAMLLGEPTPEVTVDREQSSHIRNDIGAFNEVWVEALADRAPTEVLAMFDDYTARRLAILRAMPLDEWDAETFTPVGRESYGRFMQIRVFDCWFHEQDIRDAIGRPGGETGLAVEVALDELAPAMGFVVGKKAGAPTGSSVRFVLTGASGRTIEVMVDERARVVDGLDGAPTVTITAPLGVFTRLCGGRVPLESVRAQVEVSGDAALGDAVLGALNYTI